MNWIDYAKDIDLFEVFNKDVKPMSKSEKYRTVRVLIDYFSKEGIWNTKNLPDTYDARRNMLRGILNVYPPKEIDPVNLELLERLLITECKEKNTISVDDIPDVEKNISIFNGDITTIKSDAIVNAANSKLLGCMQPLHMCIDNAIHSAAGPRLRKDCNIIIEKQNHLEYTGSAKITRAYCLPSKYVIHTVGPIVSSLGPTKEQEKQLSSCYNSCLNIVKDIDNIKNIVFCCISTGVFGYPKEDAAKIAVKTVKKWMEDNSERELKVVFNVYKDSDEEIYRHILSK